MGVPVMSSVVISNGGDVATSVPVISNGNPAELTVSGCTAALTATGTTGASCTLSLTFKASASALAAPPSWSRSPAAPRCSRSPRPASSPAEAPATPAARAPASPRATPDLTCATATLDVRRLRWLRSALLRRRRRFLHGSRHRLRHQRDLRRPHRQRRHLRDQSPVRQRQLQRTRICCAADQSGCSGSCVSLATDNSNCGVCGKKCTPGTQTCTNGACRANDAQPCAIRRTVRRAFVDTGGLMPIEMVRHRGPGRDLWRIFAAAGFLCRRWRLLRFKSQCQSDCRGLQRPAPLVAPVERWFRHGIGIAIR